jgi:hypothetical protein
MAILRKAKRSIRSILPPCRATTSRRNREERRIM